MNALFAFGLVFLATVQAAQYTQVNLGNKGYYTFYLFKKIDQGHPDLPSTLVAVKNSYHKCYISELSESAIKAVENNRDRVMNLYIESLEKPEIPPKYLTKQDLKDEFENDLQYNICRIHHSYRFEFDV